MQTISLPEITLLDSVTETPAGQIVVPGLVIPARMAVIEPETVKKMIEAARLATESAYHNYSTKPFPVGAAVIMADDGEGEIFSASNSECGVLNAGICAERALLHYVASKGFRRIKYLAVSTPNKDKDISGRSPCGLCRQTISEFSDENTLIFLDRGKNGLADVLDIARLLPYQYHYQND